MSLVQSFSEVNQLTSDVATSSRSQQFMNEDSLTFTAQSAFVSAVPAPAKEETTETEVRQPLKDISKHTKGNSETPDQEQEQEGTQSAEGADKINDYVAKVLEKLVSQRNKVSRLTTLMEQKGLVVDKKGLQIGNLSQEFEQIVASTLGKDALVENSDENKGRSKENLSPVKSRQLALKAETDEGKNSSPVANSYKLAPKYELEDVIEISRTEINYGKRFPGQIAEEEFEIINKSGQDFVVQIFVSCLNEELENTDEYVFSVRRSHLYDYNDKHFLIMAPYSSATFKFALKVPNVRSTNKILGEVKIAVQGLSGNYLLNLTADVTIPKVFCPKELFCKGLEYSVIKLAVKEGKKQEMKIPFRNTGDVPVTLELEFYEPKVENKPKGQRALFDCMVHPNVITIAPNSQTLSNILIKPWKVLSVVKGLEKQKPSRKILIGRVRDSSIVYSFVFWVEIY